MMRKIWRQSSPTIRMQKMRQMAKSAQATLITYLNSPEDPSAHSNPTEAIKTIKLAAAKQIIAIKVL